MARRRSIEFARTQKEKLLSLAFKTVTETFSTQEDVVTKKQCPNCKKWFHPRGIGPHKKGCHV